MITGEKYYKKDKLIRILTNTSGPQINKDKVLVRDELTKKTEIMNRKDILRDYIRLIPQSFISIELTHRNDHDFKDALTISYKCNSESYMFNSLNPFIIDTYYGFYYNFVVNDDVFHYKNNPDAVRNSMKLIVFTEDDAMQYYENEKESIYTTTSSNGCVIAYYADDTLLGDIIELIPKAYKKSYDDILKFTNDTIKEEIGLNLEIDTLEKLIKKLEVQIVIDASLCIETIDKIDFEKCSDKNFNTLYKFSLADMEYICKFVLGNKIKNYMIIKYWYDVDLSKFLYKYLLIRDLTTGSLFILLYNENGIIMNNDPLSIMTKEEYEKFMNAKPF